MDFYIYAHQRKDTGETFYIGRGVGNRAESWKNRNDRWWEVASRYGRTVKYLLTGLERHQVIVLEVAITAMCLKTGCKLTNKNMLLSHTSKRGIGIEHEGQLLYPWRNAVSTARKFDCVANMAAKEHALVNELNAVLDGKIVVTSDGWYINEPKGAQR